MVLEDGETCAIAEGSKIVEFDNNQQADAFADGYDFDLEETNEAVEIPVYRARKI